VTGTKSCSLRAPPDSENCNKPRRPHDYQHAARFALARALAASPETRPRALALAREARAGYRQSGGSAAEIAKIDDWLRGQAR
jgi:hypothetical protein